MFDVFARLLQIRRNQEILDGYDKQARHPFCDSCLIFNLRIGFRFPRGTRPIDRTEYSEKYVTFPDFCRTDI